MVKRAPIKPVAKAPEPSLPEKIADAFLAEAGSHFQIANERDPGGTYRLIVRKHCPSVAWLLKDRPLLIQAITDALAGKASQESGLRAAKEREEREGADRAKSGEWILAIPRGGDVLTDVYEAWDADGWYLANRSGIGDHILWDGQHRAKVMATKITKEQAVERLMTAAYLKSLV